MLVFFTIQYLPTSFQLVRLLINAWFYLEAVSVLT